jgi:hypothetical protein
LLEKPSNCLQAPQRSSLKASAQEIDPTGKFPQSLVLWQDCSDITNTRLCNTSFPCR